MERIGVDLPGQVDADFSDRVLRAERARKGARAVDRLLASLRARVSSSELGALALEGMNMRLCAAAGSFVRGWLCFARLWPPAKAGSRRRSGSLTGFGKNAPSWRARKQASVLSILLACFSAPSAGTDGVQTSDDFLRGYITSVLERDLKWERDSYNLEVQYGIATLRIIEGGPERQGQAENVLARVDSLKDFRIVVGPQGVERTTRHPRVPFPRDDIFRPLVADPKEPQIFVTLAQVDTVRDQFAAALVGVGGTFGLMRWPGESVTEGWQLDWFVGVFSQFNLDESSQDLINTDYVVGLPLTYRRGDFSTRLRLLHQSSHLGDEFILGRTAPERINLSVEAVDATLAYDWGGWRGYGGGGYLIRRDPDDLKEQWLRAGFDYVGSTRRLLNGRLIGGVDMQWFEETDWDAGISLKVGLAYGGASPDRRGIRVMLEAYDGFVPFGQFFGDDIEYYGIGAYFDL